MVMQSEILKRTEVSGAPVIYFAAQMDVSFLVGSQAILPAVIHQHFGHSLFLAAWLAGISYPSNAALFSPDKNPSSQGQKLSH